MRGNFHAISIFASGISIQSLALFKQGEWIEKSFLSTHFNFKASSLSPFPSPSASSSSVNINIWISGTLIPPSLLVDTEWVSDHLFKLNSFERNVSHTHTHLTWTETGSGKKKKSVRITSPGKIAQWCIELFAAESFLAICNNILTDCLCLSTFPYRLPLLFSRTN